ncbi:hypothetical protein LTR85_002992 [Meristemomyces frigidus]|nr:hypothetical protein LTR85_002992 [Meristemomyces frigidus]
MQRVKTGDQAESAVDDSRPGVKAATIQPQRRTLDQNDKAPDPDTLPLGAPTCTGPPVAPTLADIQVADASSADTSPSRSAAAHVPPADAGSATAQVTFEDIFAHTEVEIDWWAADGARQGFIALEEGDDVHDFFDKIDDEVPPTLQAGTVRAVGVEHINPQEGPAGTLDCAMARSSGGRLKILDIERSLGVWWPLGFSRHKDRLKIPIVKRLEDGVKKITPVFGAKNQTEIRASEELRVEAERLFKDVGPELWPDAEHDRSAWLTDAAQNDLNGHYPRDLYYSNDEDQARLWDLFYLLIIAKTIRYYENHGRGWSYEPDPVEAKAEHVEQDGADGLHDHFSDDAEDSDYETGTTNGDTGRLDAGGRRRSRHSPSGFTPVNGTSLRPSLNPDEDRSKVHEQPQATSVGAFRPSLPAAPGEHDHSLKAPSPRSSKKRKGTEDAELQANKRAKQQPTARASSGSSVPTHITLLNPTKRAAQNSEPGTPADAGPSAPRTAEADSSGTTDLPPRYRDNMIAAGLSSGAGFTNEPTSRQSMTMTPARPRSLAEEILGVFADSPVARQVLSQNGDRLNATELERMRHIFEGVPVTRVDAQALMAEMSRISTANNQPFEHQSEHLRTDLADRHLKADDKEGFAERRNGDQAAAMSNEGQRHRASNGQMGPPQYIPAPFNGASGLPRHDTDVGAMRAPAYNYPGNGAPPLASAMGNQNAPSFTPAQGASTTVEPKLEGVPHRLNAYDIFERTEVEIDWWADGQVQGFMQLDAGDDVDTFFRKLDDEMPPTLQGRDVRAVRIEHLNPVPDTGRPFNARIRRGGVAGFKALVRRLEQQAFGSVPELMVTVEWET